tara:strand:+ start:211 stop:822 length:612 start_codon:yes stop_codon:yes gene_type:complete
MKINIRIFYYLIATVYFGALVSCSRLVSNRSLTANYLLPTSSYHQLQSPINVNHLEVSEGFHELSANYQVSHKQLAHKAHTVQFDYDLGSSVVFDSAEYILRQFHFHTPSEHLIDGTTYPLEIHLVHTREADGIDEDYLVIAVLFKTGHEDMFLKEIIDLVPETKGTTAHYRNDFINIGDLVLDNINKYYFYKGSLTTPPYTE